MLKAPSIIDILAAARPCPPVYGSKGLRILVVVVLVGLE